MFAYHSQIYQRKAQNGRLQGCRNDCSQINTTAIYTTAINYYCEIAIPKKLNRL